MTNLLDLTQFRTLKELQDYANAQFLTISTMKEKLDDQKNKIAHLESLLVNKATVLGVDSQSEEIAKIEINRMYQKVLKAPLDFAEVKALETFTKILLAAKGKEVDEKKEKKTEKALKQLSPQELINIALQKTPEEQESEGN
jgi:CRISPR/Cas system CSM-associated protein Csm4 (group 5 of RAMP superfamily)